MQLCLYNFTDGSRYSTAHDAKKRASIMEDKHCSNIELPKALVHISYRRLMKVIIKIKYQGH